MREFELDDAYIDDVLGPPRGAMVPPPAVPLSLEYPPSLPKDLALLPDAIDDVLGHYNLARQDYHRLLNNHQFCLDYAEWQRKVVQDGYGVTARAELLVKEGLVDLSQAMRDVDVGVETKLKIQTYFASLAGLTNKKETVAPQRGTQVNIQINL